MVLAAKHHTHTRQAKHCRRRSLTTLSEPKGASGQTVTTPVAAAEDQLNRHSSYRYQQQRVPHTAEPTQGYRTAHRQQQQRAVYTTTTTTGNSTITTTTAPPPTPYPQPTAPPPPPPPPAMAAIVDSKAAAASTVYNPYKIFQAAQRCMGDPTVVAKVLVELLGDCAAPDVLMASAAGVVEIYYGKGRLRQTSMTDFGKFAGELAEEFEKRDSPQAEEKMKEARSVYELFEEADIDRNGSISKEEFIRFGSNIDVPTEAEALELFARVDTDNNGVISFVEWLQFCVPGAGRDEHSFNCAGHHGLLSCNAAADGVECNWCSKSCPKGSRMFSCRECNADACLECAVRHLQTCETRISCERSDCALGTTTANTSE